MADMVMRTGIDAAGDFNVQLTNLDLARLIGKTLREGLRNGDRARGGKRALIKAGAGDNIGDQSCIGTGEISSDQSLPDSKKIILLHMR